MSAKRRRRASMVICFYLAACTATADQEAADGLCSFAPRQVPMVVAHYDQRRQIIKGEIDPQVVAGYTSSIPSALAKPRKETFTRRIRKDCYDAARKAYYACAEEVTVDLTGHGTLVRGFNLERAGELAVDLCNKQIGQVVPEIVNERQISAESSCVTVVRRYCPVP